MDSRAVDRALALDAQWIEGLRCAWRAVVEEAVWGDIRGARPGQSGRVKKQALELGERLRSLAASRDWIPRPRERLKNALASALGVEEALGAIEREATGLHGQDVRQLERSLVNLRAVLEQRLPELKTGWAKLLDASQDGASERGVCL